MSNRIYVASSTTCGNFGDICEAFKANKQVFVVKVPIIEALMVMEC